MQLRRRLPGRLLGSEDTTSLRYAAFRNCTPALFVCGKWTVRSESFYSRFLIVSRSSPPKDEESAIVCSKIVGMYKSDSLDDTG